MSGTIRTELIGSDTAKTCGVTAKGSTPILQLCRLLLAAGHEPSARLEAYRGDVLCLRVRSIGEGSRLEIAGNGVGFRPPPKMATRPAVSEPAPAYPKQPLKKRAAS